MRTAVGSRIARGCAVLAVASSAIAGCAGGTTASDSDASATGTTASTTPSAPTASASSAATAALTFCSAAKAWATAPAQEQFRKAVAAGDNAGATQALLAWTAATKQMTAALPDDAPEDVEQAFATFTATIEGAGQGTVKTDAQGEFQLASQTVTAYVGAECTSSPSPSASVDSSSPSPSLPSPTASGASSGASSPSPSPSVTAAPTE